MGELGNAALWLLGKRSAVDGGFVDDGDSDDSRDGTRRRRGGGLSKSRYCVIRKTVVQRAYVSDGE